MLVTKTDYNAASFWRVITQLAVPSFVMLSGAFNIKEDNGDFKLFYYKTVRKIVIPTMVFSVIYVLMHYTEIMIAIYIGTSVNVDRLEIWSPLLNWIKGAPHVTMWYMYMIIPLYMVTPIIVMVKNTISRSIFRWASVIIMAYSVIVAKSCTLSWILQFAEWIGYYMCGDVIREWCMEYMKRKNHRICQMLGYGMIFAAYFGIFAYWYIFSYQTGHIVIPGSFSWIVIIAVFMQFAGISLIRTKKWNCISLIAKHSLNIYLIHPIFCEICAQLFGWILKRLPCGIFIPIYSCLILGLCICISIAYSKLMMRLPVLLPIKWKQRANTTY